MRAVLNPGEAPALDDGLITVTGARGSGGYSCRPATNATASISTSWPS